MLKYRPEIDGLRCIAVLSVVIYHVFTDSTNTPWISGGYLGVDIFFVLSGYLITLIILKDLQNQEFSFIDFYHRRCRRILPALFLVISVSLPFAWYILMPTALKEYAGSVLSSLFFGSNFWFFNEDAYTAAPSQLKPFLHTWSLSVEEQFYLLFPVAALFLSKLSPKTKLIIAVIIFTLSLATAHYSSHLFTNFSFYLLPSRVWELLTGAILAGIVLHKPTRELSTRVHNFLSVVTVLLLFLPLFFFTKSTLHPSVWTLLPVIGTAMAICFAQQQGWLNSLLSLPPMAWVGKWSYSLYLWHFPVFAFARVSTLTLTGLDKFLLIILSCLLAIVSYYLIEQPMRHKTRCSTAFFFTVLGAWFIGLLIIFFYLYASNGVPKRLGDIEAIYTSAQALPLQQNKTNCHQRLAHLSCKFNTTTTQNILINVGDSHANAMANELKTYSEKNNIGYLQMSEDACPLVKDGYGFREGKMIPNCHYGGQIPRLNTIKSIPKSIVIYSGRFPLYLSAERFDNKEGGVEQDPISWISHDNKGTLRPEKTISLVQNTIREMLNNNHFVVIIYPVPEVGWDVPLRIQQYLNQYPKTQHRKKITTANISTDYQVYKTRTKLTFAMYDAIADHPNLIRIYPDRLFCSEKNQRCRTHNDVAIYYQDDDHISPFGAQLIVNQISKKIQQRQWLKNK